MPAEQLAPSPEPLLPSGYAHAEQLPGGLKVDSDTLPWLQVPQELSIARCVLQSGEPFYVASAVGTHSKLVEAASGMNRQQQQNADNMFYSRLPELVQHGHASNVEVMPDPVTPFTVQVMRNRGGQRVHVGRPSLDLDGLGVPLFVRLAVCDKNKQSLVMGVLSGMSNRASRRKLSK